MYEGCFTALITPFNETGMDKNGLDALLDFQVAGGVDGILAAGTTGESPTLTWEEHNLLVRHVADRLKSKCMVIAGEGSNNTVETMEGTRFAEKAGACAVLLVDPYYNGPSSLEIRREYVEPVAAAFPDMGVIPYVIPGRTGAQLFPEDLAIASAKYKNVSAVKEATGSLENMRRTRLVCGAGFSILSGDDVLTLGMALDPEIKANGVISVMSNIAPKAVTDMTRAFREGRKEEALRIEAALKPLFGIVTVKTTEQTPYGGVVCRARNPLAVKSLMALLGMPSGPCRRPIGKMTRQGMEKVVAAASQVWRTNPEVLAPVGAHFGVDVGARLADTARALELCYGEY
jgi:4-hydroxy-tetrahydrodipicolinate synthase